MYRKAFFRALSKLSKGAVSVVDEHGKKFQFGVGTPYGTLIIHDRRFYRKIVLQAGLGFGEAYMDGWIDIDGPLDSIGRLYEENKQRFTPFGKVSGYRHDPNVKKRQRTQIQRHYDLGNDFYSLWLDASMTYTCAYFEQSNYTLEQAQAAKLKHVLKKLQLQPGMTLLDIGSGWGNLLFTAAQTYDIHGVGVTLSEEQFRYCQQKAKELGLNKQLKFRLQNYQDINPATDQFDRIVSVGMFEHIGRQNLPRYMQKVQTLLADQGVSVLHTIAKQNEAPLSRWLDKYIFPGGYIPSTREIIHLLPDYGFRLLDVENLRLNYALTLDMWLQNFDANTAALQKMYDERFVRMWRFWLAQSSASFRYGQNDLMQIVFSKGINNNLPLTRAYQYRS